MQEFSIHVYTLKPHTNVRISQLVFSTDDKLPESHTASSPDSFLSCPFSHQLHQRKEFSSIPSLETRNYFSGFFSFSFYSRECLSSLSGDSFVLLNRHGVQGQNTNHTQYECIHERLLSTYVNIDSRLFF